MSQNRSVITMVKSTINTRVANGATTTMPTTREIINTITEAIAIGNMMTRKVVSSREEIEIIGVEKIVINSIKIKLIRIRISANTTLTIISSTRL